MAFLAQDYKKLNNFIDSFISYFAPDTGLRRIQARIALEFASNYKRRFDGASKSARQSGWSRPGTSANAAIKTSLATLRNGARDLTRNNVWAARALQVVESNTIGTGVVAQIKIKNPAKDKKVTAIWENWTKTTAIDFNESMDLIALQSLFIRTIFESGEVLIVKRYKTARKNDFPVSIQVLEPDYLDVSRDAAQADGGYIEQGIQYDKENNILGYWLYRSHPGDNANIYKSLPSVFFKAEDVIHAYDKKRAGQSRGYPWISPAIRRLKDFDDYEDAQLVRQKIAACFSTFIHDMNAPTASTGLPAAEKEFSVEYLQPGLVETLPAGKQITFASPPGVQNYSEYSKSMLLGVSAALGITYESLTTDYSNVNFSSGRMGHLEMNRNILRWQTSILKIQILDKLKEWFFDGLNLQGIKTDDIIIDWIFPRREMVDPTKEIPAMIKQRRAGLTSNKRLLASLGYDFDQVMDEIEAENKIYDAKKIILDSDPRKTNSYGQMNEPDPQPIQTE